MKTSRNINIFTAFIIISTVFFFMPGHALAVETVQNGNFSAGMNNWVLEEGIPAAWNPVIAGTVHLNPPVQNYTGAVIYQNMNVTGIGNKTFTFSMDFIKNTSAQGNKTVSVYAVYVDSAGNVHHEEIINPDNAGIAASPVPPSTPTPVTKNAAYTFPADAQKLIMLSIDKEDNLGDFYVDNVSFSADGITIGNIPTITTIAPLSGSYGTTITITGSNFGADTGKVYLGDRPSPVISWSDTSITAAAHDTGTVRIMTASVMSNPGSDFTVTGSYFSFLPMRPEITVIKGQAVEQAIRVDFFNGFSTAGGISFTATGISGASFVPASVSSPGGTLLKIDTSALAAGTYLITIKASDDTQGERTDTFTLNVVTVSSMEFYKTDPNNPVQTTPITEKTVTAQGLIGESYAPGISVKLNTSDGKAIYLSRLGIADPGNMPVTITSSDPNVVGAYLRYWGYELYALANGNSTITATAADGTTATLPVTVAVSQGTNVITAISVTPSSVSNKWKAADGNNITLHAEANYDLKTATIGMDMAGLLNFSTNLNDPNTATTAFTNSDHTIDIAFHITNPPDHLGTPVPADLGTALVNVDNAYVPLTTYNDPSYSGLKLEVKNVDSSVFIQDSMTIGFYTPDNTTTPTFTKNIWSMGLGDGIPVDVGGIPPGTYKLKFSVPFGSPLPNAQWWPNAASPANADTVTFTAGSFTDNIIYFAAPAPTIYFAGSIKTDDGNGTDIPVADAAITLVDGTPSTTSDVNGNFVLTPIPADQQFSLKLDKTGVTDIYTADFTSSYDITAPVAYYFFPGTQLATWGNTTGNGMIIGMVADAGNAHQPLSGATVTITNTSNGKTYDVVYMDADNDTFGTAQTTTSQGVFAILNVDAAATLTLSASKGGYTAATPALATTRANAATEVFFSMKSPIDDVEAAFQTMVDTYNAKNLNGLTNMISADYLNNGKTRADFLTEAQSDWNDPDFQPAGYTITSSSINGEIATLEVRWSDGGGDIMTFKKENGSWKLYGNQFHFEAEAFSGYQAAPTPDYWASIRINDPNDSITSVNVTGPGITAPGISLNHNTGQKVWVTWATDGSPNDVSPHFGNTRPALPLNYTVTINFDNNSRQEIRNLSVESFLDNVSIQNAAPADGQNMTPDESRNLTFSWDNPGNGYTFGIQLFDQNNNMLWSKWDLDTNSVAYDGPALGGGAYHYVLSINDDSGNSSMSSISFSIIIPGDLTGDGSIGLDDAITALQVLSGIGGGHVSPAADINGDGKIGMAEFIYLLQHLAGLR